MPNDKLSPEDLFHLEGLKNSPFTPYLQSFYEAAAAQIKTVTFKPMANVKGLDLPEETYALPEWDSLTWREKNDLEGWLSNLIGRLEIERLRKIQHPKEVNYD